MVLVIADPNLSLMAWRSATIVNSLTKKNIYPIEDQGSFIDWQENAAKKNQSPEQKDNQGNGVVNFS